jgi:hypothetical protein
MYGTLTRPGSRNSNSLVRNVRNYWRGYLTVLGLMCATIGVAIAAIDSAYEWQLLTVFAAGLTAILGVIVVKSSTLSLQYRSTRFALSNYVVLSTLVGMVWAGAFANSADVLNVLWYGMIASFLTFCSLALPAKKKSGKVFTFTAVRPSATPWSW